MANIFPDRKVGLITFNGEICVTGDAQSQNSVIAGDKLNSFDFLVENGRKEAKAKLQGKVKDTKADLQK